MSTTDSSKGRTKRKIAPGNRSDIGWGHGEEVDPKKKTLFQQVCLFGMELPVMTRTKKSPADWWDSYGDDVPELQIFAIKMLRKNHLHQEKMNGLVFVMYNLKLFERQARRMRQANVTYDVEDISSDDEWITEKEDHVLPPQKNWLHAQDRIAHREAEKEQEIDPEMEVENMVNNLTDACGDDLGLDQYLDGYEFEHYNPEDGNNQVPSTYERQY